MPNSISPLHNINKTIKLFMFASYNCFNFTGGAEKKSGKGPFDGISQLNSDDANMDELLGLCSGQFTEKEKPRRISSTQILGTQENMDELLGLCSGQFTGKVGSTQKRGNGGLMTSTQATQGNMDELLGLCSGQFSEKGASPTQKVAAGLLSTQADNTQGNIDKLLGLHSGNFAGHER